MVPRQPECTIPTLLSPTSATGAQSAMATTSEKPSSSVTRAPASPASPPPPPRAPPPHAARPPGRAAGEGDHQREALILRTQRVGFPGQPCPADPSDPVTGDLAHPSRPPPAHRAAAPSARPGG